MTTRCIQPKHLVYLSAILAIAMWPSVSKAVPATYSAEANVGTWGTVVVGGVTELNASAYIPSTQYPTIAAWDAGALAAHVSPAAFSPTGLTFTGNINLTYSDLIVNADNSTDSVAAYSFYYQAAKAGYNQGTWTGNSGPSNGVGLISDSSVQGVGTPSAATDGEGLTGVGVILNDGATNNVGGNDTAFTTFDGQAVGADTVLAKFTYYGDTQFNGYVSEQDVVNTVDGRDFSLNGWANGETAYTGSVSQQDVTNVVDSRDFWNSDTDMFDPNYNVPGTSTPQGTGNYYWVGTSFAGASDPATATSFGAVSVPEPSSGLIALMAAFGLAAFTVFRRRGTLARQVEIA